jgi:alpha-tubulin suppressor-like RCC1 family protein
VFVHGSGACEELGISEQSYQGKYELSPVRDVDNLQISQIACGEGFSLFLTSMFNNY